MTGYSSKAGRLAALLACATMIAAPATAATATKPTKPVPITLPLSAKPAEPIWTPGDESAANHRRWRHRRGGDGIDGGDIVGGLLILGGIAAVAGAIKKSKEESRERTRGEDYRYPDARQDGRYDDRERNDRDWDAGNNGSPREIDRAVEACSAEAGRSGRVDEIYDVDQVDGEWRVRGDFEGGGEFTCTTDRNGRAYIGTGDRARNSDWDARGGDDQAPYPQVIGAGGDDGRYDTAQTPDFEDSRGR